MMNFLKSAGKLAAILGGFYIVSLVLSGLDFETRVGWLLFGLGMAVAYVDGTQKDRMAALEARISELEYQLRGDYRQYPFDGS